MKKAGRAELEQVYSTFIDLISAHLVYTPQHEESRAITEWAGDWHHGGVEVVVGHETVSVPAHYGISHEGGLKIREYERKLVRTYPLVELLEKHFPSFEDDLSPEELRMIYKESPIPRSRTVAGEELGYSKLRIFAHEHPVAATVTGIAIAGTASGLGYMLLQYLSK